MLYDIIVIGGGPAGLAAATLLARAGKQVLLLDRLSEQGNKVGESLPASVNALLHSIGMQPLQTPPHKTIHGANSLWAGQPLQQDFISHAQGPGWRLDRRRFENELFEQAIESGVEHRQALLKTLVRNDDQHWLLSTDEGNTLTAEFIIDASGRRAIVPQLMGAAKKKYAPLIALWSVGTAAAEAGANDKKPTSQTLIESQDDGWWYAAFLPNNKPMAIFHTAAQAAARLRRDPGAWLEQLSSTLLISKHIDPVHFCEQAITACDARSLHLKQAYDKGWAACGDAALSFDPISSQGIFNAMASAEMLVKALLADNQEQALEAYQNQLADIAHIYQQRRQAFYQRASLFHQSTFWNLQLQDRP